MYVFISYASIGAIIVLLLAILVLMMATAFKCHKYAKTLFEEYEPDVIDFEPVSMDDDHTIVYYDMQTGEVKTE